MSLLQSLSPELLSLWERNTGPNTEIYRKRYWISSPSPWQLHITNRKLCSLYTSSWHRQTDSKNTSVHLHSHAPALHTNSIQGLFQLHIWPSSTLPPSRARNNHVPPVLAHSPRKRKTLGMDLMTLFLLITY